ncbi:MAG: tryptophan synthase subunit alpha [Anaerolineae bacterium]|nr:tryptophan synthase subunit alpha [Anaerolineae bacterium]
MTDTRTTTGLDAIAAMFDRAKAEGRSAFLPYVPVGYPDYESSLDAVEALAALDVDGFEIGMPFSDPLADGPTIQEATQIALENGTTIRSCLEAVRALRSKGLQQPMLMMGYLNPMLAYGTEAFVHDVKAAGADGLIIPDLPPEEAHLFAESCAREGLALIFFLAPTSNEERIKLVAERASGFIYVVSVTGVTGARRDLPPDLVDYINRLRAHTDVPLVMGFGISTPDHARQVNKLLDGFIVASALIRASKQGIDPMRELAASIRQAIEPGG